MPGRVKQGRRLAYLTIAVGILVLGVGIYALKDRLLERWYLWGLESSQVDTRRAAAERLGKMGSVRAIPALLRTVRNHSDVFGIATDEELKYLTLMGPHEDASALASFLAVRSITETQARKAAPYLLTALRESQSAFHFCRGPIEEEQAEEVEAGLIMIALAKAGEAAREGVPAIREFLERREPKSLGSRAAAIVALGEIDPKGKEVFQSAVDTLSRATEGASVRCAAADALGKIGRYHAETTTVLRAALQDEDAQVRQYAGRALKTLKRSRRRGAPGE